MGAGLLALARAPRPPPSKALAAADLPPHDIDVLIYAGVCREQFEPATACAVAHELGINPDAAVLRPQQRLPRRPQRHRGHRQPHRTRPGAGRAGGVLPRRPARSTRTSSTGWSGRSRSSCSASRVATLTGGSGAVAVLVVGEELSREKRRRLLGGVTQNAPQHHALCRWGVQSLLPVDGRRARVGERGRCQKGSISAGALVHGASTSACGTS